MHDIMLWVELPCCYMIPVLFNIFCLGPQEIVINVALILRFLAAGVASAVFASKWGGPPPSCTDSDEPDYEDLCDSVPLSATNALQCVSIATH